MKSCPTCNRTYSDETLAFCLIDGSVLSAPFKAQAQPPPAAHAEPPPTEVLKQGPSRGDTIPTPRLQETMPSYPSLRPPTQSARGSGSAKWIALGIAVLVVVVIAGVGILLVGRSLLSGEVNQNRDGLLSGTSDGNNRPTPESSPSPERLDISGSWTGINDGDPTTLIINASDTNSYLGTEIVSTSTAKVKLSIEIRLDPITRHITINETQILEGVGSWNLGFNQGTISADGTKMNGTAKDIKEKTYSWSFTKK